MSGGENGLMRDREVAKRGSSGAEELTDSGLKELREPRKRRG